MGKFVTRGNIDKMTREEAEAAANQELQQKIGARGQASAADEPVESQLAVPAWARESRGEGLLARLARQRRQAAVEPDDGAELEAAPAPTRRRSTRSAGAATASGTGRSTGATPSKRAAASRATKAVKATRATKTAKAAGATKAPRTTRVTKPTKAAKTTKRRTR